MSFQGSGGRFHSKNITNSTVSQHISSNSKERAVKRSFINKTVVFKRDVEKSSRHSSSWKDKLLINRLTKVDFIQNNLSVLKGHTIPTNSKFYENEQKNNLFMS